MRARTPRVTVSWYVGGETFSRVFHDAITAAWFATSLEALFLPCEIRHG